MTINNIGAGYDIGEALPTPVYFDSGGGFGTIPQSLLANVAGYPPIPSLSPVGSQLASGTSISVSTYTTEPLSLYGWEETVPADPGPVVVGAGGVFNTGNEPFAEELIYVSNSPSGVGTMYFDD